MKSIKLFFLLLFSLYNLFSGTKLVFSEADDDELEDEIPNDIDPNKAKERAGLRTFDEYASKVKDEDKSDKNFGDRKNEDEDATTLTDDEEKKAADLEAAKKKTEENNEGKDKDNKEEPAAEGKIKFAGKEIDEAEFTELYDDAKKHYGEAFDKFDESVKQKILEDRLNLKEGRRETDKEHQRQAARDKDFEKQELALKAREENLSVFEEDHKSKIAELEAKIKDLPGKIDSEEDDDARSDLRLDLRDAKKELLGLKDGKVKIYDEYSQKDVSVSPEDAIKIEKRNLQLLHDINFYETATSSLMKEFGDDFKTSIKLEELSDPKVLKNASTDDRMIFRQFKNVYRDYMEETTEEERAGYTLADFYREEKRRYPKIERENISVKEKPEKKEEKASTARELYKILSKNKEAIPPKGDSGNIITGKDDEGEAEEKAMSKRAKEHLIGKRVYDPAAIN